MCFGVRDMKVSQQDARCAVGKPIDSEGGTCCGLYYGTTVLQLPAVIFDVLVHAREEAYGLYHNATVPL